MSHSLAILNTSTLGFNNQWSMPIIAGEAALNFSLISKIYDFSLFNILTTSGLVIILLIFL